MEAAAGTRRLYGPGRQHGRDTRHPNEAGDRTSTINAIHAHGRYEDRFCYVWGQVRYKDGIDNTVRITNFCHRYNCEALREDNTIPEEHARYRERGNDAT